MMNKLRPDQVETLLDFIEGYVKELISSSDYGEYTTDMFRKRQYLKDYIMELIGEEKDE
mgnify:CR=1 FL=1